MPEPKPIGREIHAEYKKAVASGYRPLAEAQLEPWQHWILKRAVKHTLAEGVGRHRKLEGTDRAIARISPIVAHSLVEKVRESMSKEDAEEFGKIMGAFIKDPAMHAKGRIPNTLKESANRIGQQSWTHAFTTIAESRSEPRFHTDNKQRWYARRGYDFRKDVDFQLNHDISFSFYAIWNFLGALRPPLQ